jgi:hypothetical protein
VAVAWCLSLLAKLLHSHLSLGCRLPQQQAHGHCGRETLAKSIFEPVCWCSLRCRAGCVAATMCVAMMQHQGATNDSADCLHCARLPTRTSQM